jgi:hypothetical protein
MGMDPLDNKETLEVIFELNGPINSAKLKEFQTKINDFLAACALVDNGVEAGKKLKLRVHRTGVRKKLDA